MVEFLITYVFLTINININILDIAVHTFIISGGYYLMAFTYVIMDLLW